MDPTHEMRAWCESRAEEMAGLLEELVAVDTENLRAVVSVAVAQSSGCRPAAGSIAS